MKQRTVTLLATSCFAGLALLVGMGLEPAAAAPAVDWPIGPPRGCKKVVSSSCTSCSESGVMDIECKSGTVFEDCNTGFTSCQNGSQCDQHEGSGSC